MVVDGVITVTGESFYRRVFDIERDCFADGKNKRDDKVRLLSGQFYRADDVPGF